MFVVIHGCVWELVDNREEQEEEVSCPSPGVSADTKLHTYYYYLDRVLASQTQQEEMTRFSTGLCSVGK